MDRMRSDILLNYSQMDLENVYRTFNSCASGITDQDAEEKLTSSGLNEISGKKGNLLTEKLWNAIWNPFNLVLSSLALTSFFTDICLAPVGEKSWRTVIVIMAMVILSVSIKFIQEYKSSKAEEALKNLVRTTAAVERGGEVKEIDIRFLVPGDIIHLASGDMIPGDMRVISSKDLFISQSTFTGESEPVEKFSDLKKDNICLMGTNVLSGTGKGIIIATGKNTYFGFLAETLMGKKEKTSFEKGVDSVAKLFMKFMIIMTPIVFIINGFTKENWLEALLFSVSVAVGLTPEMLPMIVTTNLAKGALSLSKKKTIIKKLDSIQNFGAMDVFCSDKTGTLTMDKIILQRHLDIEGNQSDMVMTYGYFNSLYQTGLKNLMDKAIISRGNEEGLSDKKKDYTKIDEIPFDFNRRRMSVVIGEKEGKREIITKGAIEEMLAVSTTYELDGAVFPITETIKEKVRDMIREMGEEGMRVIAISKKEVPAAETTFEIQDECDMTLLGYMCFLDPPKDSAFGAIKALKKHGISVKVLTGDNEFVTRKICSEVGIDITEIVSGISMNDKNDEELKPLLEKSSIFVKLSPEQKARIVRILREMGHTVGFMGDGINDTAAIKEADVGISVDTAVDIAKETADIILLENNLLVLDEGVIEGRKIFGNIIKYIKMTASSNFGNVFSVLTASIFLPFLPMLPIQLLTQNFLYDISQTAIPWDNMDEEFIEKPRKWNANDIGRFMLYIGPMSSVFDIITFLVLWYIFKANSMEHASLFQSGWFIEGLLSQTLIVHTIRTRKIPFLESRAASSVLFMTGIIMTFGLTLPFIKLGSTIGLVPLPDTYFPILAVILLAYLALVQIMKKYYIKKFNTWL